LRDIFKLAIAAVVPKPHGRAFVRFRLAIRFVLAIQRAIEVCLGSPLDVIANDEIQVAVSVVIHPGSAGAEFVRAFEPGLLRHVGECAVAIVVKQMVLPVGGDEQIVVAVVVVITDGHAHAIDLDGQPRFVRHVGERAIVIVVIELRRGMLADVTGPVHAVDQENVGPAVVIVIDEGHAGAHSFGEIFFAEGAVVVHEMDPGLFGDVAELD